MTWPCQLPASVQPQGLAWDRQLLVQLNTTVPDNLYFLLVPTGRGDTLGPGTWVCYSALSPQANHAPGDWYRGAARLQADTKIT